MGNSGTWKKGQSGNYAGRPRKGETACDILEKLLKVRDEVDPKDPTKKISRKMRLFKKLYDLSVEGDTAAMKMLLEFMYGRPKQTISQDLTVFNPAKIEFSSVIDEEEEEEEKEESDEESEE